MSLKRYICYAFAYSAPGNVNCSETVKRETSFLEGNVSVTDVLYITFRYLELAMFANMPYENTK